MQGETPSNLNVGSPGVGEWAPQPCRQHKSCQGVRGDPCGVEARPRSLLFMGHTSHTSLIGPARPLFLLAYSNAMRSAQWSILENAGEKDQKFSHHHLDNTTVHNLCTLPDLPVHIYFSRNLFSVLEKQDHITHVFPAFFPGVLKNF